MLSILFACRTMDVISPADEATFLQSPWAPVVVWFKKEDDKPQRVEMLVDGKDMGGFGLIRRRIDTHGGGYDYLDTIDLYELDDGAHELQITAHWEDGHQKIRKQSFFIQRPRLVITFTIVDEQQRPLPGRVLILNEYGHPVNLAPSSAQTADPSGRDVSHTSVFAPTGTGQVYLLPGTYDLIAAYGFRHAIQKHTVVVRSGQDQAVDFTLAQQVYTEGWLSSDLHVHTGYSADSFIPNYLRIKSILASDVDVVVFTDHNQIIHAKDVHADWPEESVATMAGIEASFGVRKADESFSSHGHMNAFPLAQTSPIPSKTPAPLAIHIDAYRARQQDDPYQGFLDDVVLQLNHPRGIQFQPYRRFLSNAHAYFNKMKFDPTQSLAAEQHAALTQKQEQSGTTALDFDSMEILNRFSWHFYKHVRRDWFSLLNQGHAITGTGNSDSHAFELEQMGFPVTYVRCKSADELPECLVDSMHKNQAVVSNGPVLDVFLVGEAQSAVGQRVRLEEPRVMLSIHIQAASWVPVEEVRVIRNGKIVMLDSIHRSHWNEDGVLQYEVRVNLNFTKDSWVVIEAGFPISEEHSSVNQIDLLQRTGIYGHLARGHLPIGFTNPIWFDVDGDGEWEPPGIEEPE